VTLIDLQLLGLNEIEATNRILSEFPEAIIIALATYGTAAFHIAL
jgi:DNA-binding NarL/FixJ family response regulator